MPDGSMDFGYSLGVLHHISDPAAGLEAFCRKLKPGAPLLVYIYSTRWKTGLCCRAAFHASEVLRRRTSVMPYRVRLGVSQLLAGAVYWPMARLARVLEGLGVDVEGLPAPQSPPGSTSKPAPESLRMAALTPTRLATAGVPTDMSNVQLSSSPGTRGHGG